MQRVAHNSYRNASAEEKDREYGRNQPRNMFQKEKQKLKEHRKNCFHVNKITL